MAAKVDKERCIGCSAYCPVNAIKIEDDKAVINKECVECGVCINEYPNEAITISK